MLAAGSVKTAETTTDPAPSPRRPRPAHTPALEIAFHSDLRRVGDHCHLAAGAQKVGRLEPLFEGAERLLPLLDPCISREQLTIAWLGDEELFEITPGASARRPLTRLKSRERLTGPTRVPTNTWLAVGDRIVLRPYLARNAPESSPELLGGSDSMLALREQIEIYAQSEAVLLVTGETGTGKELVARAVHESSGRRDEPFIALNCAALPETLLESELFGHVPGSFTGASRTRLGVFRAAEGGTVLLDEVAELPPAAQAKLLRVLNDGSVRVVGQESETQVRCRVIAATHRALATEVAAGRFRQDLYMRLRGCEIAVPPLRERPSDVPRLFLHFLARALRELGDPEPNWLMRAASRHAPPMPLEFFQALCLHPWPGNVRELERLALATAARSSHAKAFDAPPLEPSAPSSPATSITDRRPTRPQLLAVLREHGFVQRRAAVALGVPYPTLDRWLRELRIRRARDLDRAEIQAAIDRTAGNTERAAELLEVSPRGLQRRLRELGLS